MNSGYRLKFKITWEGLILFILLIQVFAVQWLAMTYYYCSVINVILLAYLVGHYKRIKKIGISDLPFALFLLYGLIQLVRPGANLSVLNNNMLYVATSLLIVVTLASFSLNRKNLRRSFASIFPIVNIYIILNIPILILQMNGHIELSGRHAVENTNPYKADLICGLFGYNGTPILATFVAFFFVYNLWYYRHKIKKKYKTIFLIYYVLLFGFYLFIAVPSQNSGYFLVLAMFFVLYYLSRHSNYGYLMQKIRKSIKGIAIVVLMIIITVILYNHYAPFYETVNKIRNVINIGTTNYYLTGSYITGSAERFAMVTYYLTNDTNKLFGVGIGSMRWKEQLGFGFLHFGQSDMGPFLLIGGLVFVVLLTLIFANAVNSLCNSRFLMILECTLMLGMLLFTQLFTNISTAISFMLFIVVCSLEKEVSNEDEEDTKALLIR